MEWSRPHGLRTSVIKVSCTGLAECTSSPPQALHHTNGPNPGFIMYVII